MPFSEQKYLIDGFLNIRFFGFFSVTVCASVSYLRNLWEFPGGPVVRTQHSHSRGPGSIPGEGAKIPQTTSHAATARGKKGGGHRTKHNEKL